MITVFSHIKEVENPFYYDIDEVLAMIKDGRSKEQINAIRKTKDKDERNKKKQKLKSICFSGKFARRSKRNIIEASGFACLDFDEVDDPKALRDSLQDNEYIYSAFVSPSGNGVKAIVRVPASIDNYEKYYEAICETFDSNLDKSTKDISRVCYISYDPDLFINHDSKEWRLKKDYSETKNNSDFPKYFQINDGEKKIDVILAWFNKKFTLNVGERNNNLYKLACGLNKAGCEKGRCLDLFMTYYSSGLSLTELTSIIDSAYKNTNDFNSLTLIDDRKVYKTKEIIKKGVTKAKNHLKREGLRSEEIDDIVEYEFEGDYLEFWDVNKNGKISLNDYKFKLFLENRGFYKVKLNDKEFTFVKVYNNIINEINETAIKDFVLNYILDVNVDVYNFFAQSVTKFSESYLNQLATKDLAMVRDTSKASFLFFQNGVAKITKTKVELIDYMNIGGFVWEKNIIPHNFLHKPNSTTDFETFIKNITKSNDRRKDILECALGYLLTTYKKQDEGLAVVLYDETLNDNPSGRTGKTLLSKAIGKCRKLTTLNGKEFNLKGQFPYHTINLDDNVICFDDMDRSFKFETLFSIITGDLILNKKNREPIIIPFERSPKIVFTSNYILSGVGDSHDARKLEIELYRHYSKNYKPVDEFGKRFFDEWNEGEWNDFYNYMIRNIQKYLNEGLKHSELNTGKTKKLIANTCDDFYDFCENEMLFKEGKYYRTKKILQSYNDGTREMPRNMNVSWFGRWLGMYFEYKDWKREDTTHGGVRKFTVTGFADDYNNTSEDENELPF
jgi:hypothetical protein